MFKSLRSYVVIIVKECEIQHLRPAIIFSADLYHQKFPATSNYLVIGSVKLLTKTLTYRESQPQVKFSKCNVGRK